MAFSDNDDDLERAIAMSLAANDNAVVDLTSDHEGEDKALRRAIALSLGENKAAFPANPVTASQAESKSPRPSQYATLTSPEGEASAQSHAGFPTSTETTGIIGLDRKSMEQERLARLGKRKRSASQERPSKQVAKHGPKDIGKKQEPSVATDTSGGIQYPNGVVKRTWAHKRLRVNDITIGEVLQESSLNIAVLSAFQWDNPWLLENHLDPYKVKQIWIMSGKAGGEDVRQKLLCEAEEAQIPNFKVHFPPLPGQTQNMHGKLMLLFHKEYLRVVVPTANMIKFDWGETNKDASGKSWQPGLMENTIFLIDLPRRSDGPAMSFETDFGRNLAQYLKAQEVSRNVIEGILKFDLSETKHIGFVHSIAGVSSGPERARTGLPCLARTIRELKLDQISRLEIDYAASSLGAIKESFLQQIYLSASGLSPLSPPDPNTNILDHFRIYFPTKETVHNSTGGPDCGGIIFMVRDWYNAPTFPRKCFRDYESTRPGMLSHNKLLFARGCKTDGTPVAWVYIGSANISEAAWGAQKLLKKGKEGSSLMRNWECGVVVPVPEDKLKGLPKGEVPPMSVFEGTVDVPFVFPGEIYGQREPWFLRL